MFHFEYTVTESDYLAFNEFHNEKPARKSYLLVLPILVGGILLTFVLILRTPNAVLGAVVAFVAVYLMLRLNVKRLTRWTLQMTIERMKKDGKLPFGAQAQITFADDHILDISELGEKKVPYSVVEKIAETERAVYVYFSAMEAIILPLTVFEDDTQRSLFLLYMNEKTS